MQANDAARELAGLAPGFIHRVYRTTGILGLLLAFVLGVRFGWPAAAGWLLGLAWGLLILVTVEWSVRRYTQERPESAGMLLGATVAKLVGAAATFGLAYFAAKRGWIALPWALAGFPLPGIVIVLKVAGIKLRESLGPGGPPARR